MTIRILDPILAGKIAAGEVIERPASVVKELVENALDAGARAISVELRGGGVQMIRIVDDGGGIAEDEIELAFERHATSKLASLDDLDAISTLGFRGEALPSVRAVADVTILSRTTGQEFAALRRFAAGEVAESGRRGGAPGTQITVQGLFRSLPARERFLRGPAYEAAQAVQVIAHYALAYPEVRFEVLVDGKSALRAPGGTLLDAVLAVHGRSVAEAMLPVDSASAPESMVHVTGYTSKPVLSRANRTGIALFVNRRWIQSRQLSQAVESAYQNRLMVGRHPLAVIHLTISPASVDVNVHPAKLEVRLRDDREVFSAVQRAIRAALDGDEMVRDFSEPAGAPVRVQSYEDSGAQQLRFDAAAAQDEPERFPPLRVVGQIGLTYIVAEGQDGAYLVDQHAAHERVLYDRLRTAWDSGASEAQGMLEAQPVELTGEQVLAFEQHGDVLTDLGFRLEKFGPHSLLVRAAPAMLPPGEALAALGEALESLQRNPAEWRDRIAASVACHSAVRAGQTLSYPEMDALLRSLEVTASPRTCPHGRPTVLHLSSLRLQREFGRI